MFGINWFAMLALSVTALLFIGLFYLGKRGVDFGLRTLMGLGAGVVMGVLFSGNLEYVAPIGTIYIRLITAAVAPLIIVSILSSVTALGNTKKLTKLGGRSVFWLLLNTAIAILITLAAGIFLQVGKNTALVLDGVDAAKLAEKKVSFLDVIVDFFPQNIISDIQNNKIIPIIIVSLAVAIAVVLIQNKEKTAPFTNFVESLKHIVYKIVDFIVSATPYAVLALAASATSKAGSKWEAITPLLWVLVISYALCIFHTYIVNGALVLFAAKLNPIRFFRKISSAQITAFTTQSSVGTLPATIHNLVKKVGVSEEIANFTASLGTAVGMPACSGIWPVLAAIFAINLTGIEYSVIQYITLAVLALAVSFGTAGVPGTATITATAVFAAAGLPIEAIILLQPISAIADMARTAANVTAAAVSAAIVSRKENSLDDALFRAEETETFPEPDVAPAENEA